MAVELTLPRLGQGMDSGTIVRWLKAEGDAVAKGEPLYELDTEKVTQEVESDADGIVLSILASEGQEVPVGQLVALIGEPGESAPAAPPPPDVAAAPVPAVVAAAAPATPAPSRAQASAPPDGRVKASPLARRMAKERGVELAGLVGTGPEGRIVAEDVERASAQSTTPEVATAAPVAAAPATSELVASAPLASETVQLSTMRKTIARRMTESWQAPHFQVSMTADASRMIELRSTLLDDADADDPRATYSDILTKLVAVALTRHPALNAQYAGDVVHRYADVNIGLAIAVDDGLVVPVVRSCERRTVREIAGSRLDLVERARSGALTAADFDGGTFTISNLGMYGVERFMAVLNPPQVGIVAVGAIEERVVVEEGDIVVRPRMELTLSCDHRAVDGAQGSEFL
ncbi:MAG: dihydrolipoamide acetyltransferase family protein, partial [Gaiellales bacterium]